MHVLTVSWTEAIQPNRVDDRERRAVEQMPRRLRPQKAQVHLDRVTVVRTDPVPILAEGKTPLLAPLPYVVEKPIVQSHPHIVGGLDEILYVDPALVVQG